jgi:two-component system, cell cycle sensor histidine kinase and response regulator CckA
MQHDSKLIIWVLFLSTLICAPLANANTKKPNLLLISSYHPNFPTFYQQIDGIQHILPAHGYDLNVEFLDSKRFPEKSNETAFKKHLKQKLEKLPKYDLVFTSDDNALHFITENKPELFAGIPVIFLGVNDIEYAISQNQNPEITGVVEATSMGNTIHLARQLLPKLKTLHAISDNTTSGSADLTTFLETQSEFPDLQLGNLNLSTLSWKELGEQIQSLPNDDGLLLLSAYHDNQQSKKTFAESLQLILDHSKVPVFHLWEHGLNEGIMGGVVVNHFEQGKTAARIAQQILAGQAISTISVETDSPNKEVLDHNVLRKYKISPAHIPPSAEIINRPASLYRTNKKLFWAITVIFFLMTGFIFLLGFHILKNRRTERKLLRNQKLFKALFNESLQFCGIIGLDGKLLKANDSSLLAAKVSADDVIGKFFWETPWWKDTGNETQLKDAIAKGVKGETVRFLATHFTEDELTIDFSLKPIIENGQTTLLIAEGRDITELRLMQEELKQNEKMDAIGQLAGGVAHDFNNMLAGMIGFAELLGDKLTDNPSLMSYTNQIISTGQRAAELTGQLLSFARKGKQYSTSVNIKASITDTILLLERSIDKRIKIKTSYEDETAATIGDPGQLQSALLNLGVNARDAMPNGGTLSFTTRTIQLDEQHCNKSNFEITPGDYTEISVRDTGDGIPVEIMNRIFEPFFTTKAVGMGTGLGLAAVYGVITDHQGELTVTSHPELGTTFRILLPLSKQKESTQASTPNPIASAPAHNTILIMDDEPTIRTLLQSMLEKIGYQVIAACNGREGVELFKENRGHIALCIIDVMMPEMNGMEALQKIRTISPDAKIIIASGYSADSTQNDYLEAGAKAFLPKPYRMAELSTVIHEQLT